VDRGHGVYAVCDGMGGHQAGEVASMTASEIIHSLFDHFQQDLVNDSRLAVDRPLPFVGDVLVRSIRLANREIYRRAATNPDLAGMGTTIVAVALEGDTMSIAHVGDSRAYCLESQGLQPLTRDHSWISEMQQNQLLSEEDALSVVGKNVITRALGVRGTVEIDYRLAKVRPGDIFILCSDGLCGYADDDEIFAVAQRARGDIKRMVENLVQLANDRGGADNVTVIAIEIGPVSDTPQPEVDVLTLPEQSAQTLQAEDEWLARLETFKTEQAQRPLEHKSHGGGRWLLTLIFVAFVIVAAVIIYLQTAQQ
jgi:serine/threonine protein phosphatase PrpC